MAKSLDPRLVNGEAGDPGLYVDLLGRNRAFLFDLGGSFEAFEPAEILRVTDVFVSHTHIDHFIAFDQLIRWHLNHANHIRIFGPAPILENVAGRLRGYTWNLVTDRSPVVDAVEVAPDGLPVRAVRFRCGKQFAQEPAEPPCAEMLLSEERFQVRAVLCDHHNLTSAVYRCDELPMWHARPERFGDAAPEPGPWLQPALAAAAAGAPPETPVETPTGTVALGTLLDRGALVEKPGPSIGYVTDVAWSDANLERLESLLQGVTTLWCEGGFLAEDEAHARSVSHLTARDAGRLARRLGATELRTFHFSRRYRDHAPLRAEAGAAFRADPG
jgi:ribonuclease Z